MYVSYTILEYIRNNVKCQGGDKLIFNNIKNLCIKNGISISALENKMGFGNSTIQKWRFTSPSIDKLKAVADYFGVTVDELLKEGE